MSAASSATRAGVSVREFKLYATEVGQWLWGTAQGAWNEKQTLSQIITDAVIGMIPVLGDVTAVRDLTAIGTGLATNPEKREHAAEWVLLVIFVFALIPVLGGVIKGVGRIALKVTEDAVKDSRALERIAEEVITFLNRIGHKNAEAWFKALNVLSYEGEVLSRFRAFCDTFIIAINRYALRFRSTLPQSLVARMEQLSAGFTQIRALGDQMIPQALKELHERLAKLQKVVHAGGVPPPGQAKVLLAQTGQKTVTYAEEARLIESGAAKTVVHAGEYAQNVANADPLFRHALDKVYKHEAGFPDLLKRVETDADTDISYYPAIAAASGPIRNEMLEGEILFRAYGAEGVTHSVKVRESRAIGQFWGRGAPPKTAGEWRKKYAVIDEWNRNGWLSILHIPKGVKIPSCTSTVSEQFSKNIPGQYLEGGGQQAAIDAMFDKQILSVADSLYKKGGGKAALPNGVVIEIRQSGWSGINGKIGYGETVIPGAAMVERLGITEKQTKIAVQTTQGTAKEHRAQ